MLTLKVKDNVVEFIFTDYFTKKHIHSESFTFDDAEQMAKYILKMIKKEEKEAAPKRCF
jgi:hypothetical protein